MEFDLHSRVKIVDCVPPEALAVDTDGAGVDTLNFNGLEWIVHVGAAFVGGGYDITLEEDVDDGSGSPAGTWTAVPDAEILGNLSPTIAIQVIITDTDKVYRVGSIGKKRHQRVVLTETGTITAGVIGVTAVLSHPRDVPPADQNT